MSWDDNEGNDFFEMLSEYFSLEDISEHKCNHEWQEYKGILDHYFFCKICDKKKDPDEE